MRVTFNSSYRDGIKAVNANAMELAARQKEVASGKRINCPSDDPTGAVNAIAERSEIAVMDRYEQAADSVTSRLTVVDSLLSELNDQLTSAKVTVTGAQGSTATADSRSAAADQLDGIKEAVLTAMNTQYRGTYLFAGSASTTRPFTVQGKTVSAYQGSGEPIAVDVDRQVSVRSGVAGDAITKGTDASDVFTVLDQVTAAVRSGDAAGMQTGLAALGRALDRAATAQSRVGTDLATVQTQQQELQTRRLGDVSRLSSIEDSNMAESISSMTRAETAYKAALSALGSTQTNSLLDYIK